MVHGETFVSRNSPSEYHIWLPLSASSAYCLSGCDSIVRHYLQNLNWYRYSDLQLFADIYCRNHHKSVHKTATFHNEIRISHITNQQQKTQTKEVIYSIEYITSLTQTDHAPSLSTSCATWRVLRHNKRRRTGKGMIFHDMKVETLRL